MGAAENWLRGRNVIICHSHQLPAKGQGCAVTLVYISLKCSIARELGLLSPLKALCTKAVGGSEQRNQLFKRTCLWGLSGEDPTAKTQCLKPAKGTSLPLRHTDRDEVNRNRARRLTGSLGSNPMKESNRFCLDWGCLPSVSKTEQDV